MNSKARDGMELTLTGEPDMRTSCDTRKLGRSSLRVNTGLKESHAKTESNKQTNRRSVGPGPCSAHGREGPGDPAAPAKSRVVLLGPLSIRNAPRRPLGPCRTHRSAPNEGEGSPESSQSLNQRMVTVFTLLLGPSGQYSC
jgi:hypothetical protein